jgi:hypothetical protein
MTKFKRPPGVTAGVPASALRGLGPHSKLSPMERGMLRRAGALRSPMRPRISLSRPLRTTAPRRFIVG